MFRLVTGEARARYGPQCTVAIAVFWGTLASPMKIWWSPLAKFVILKVNEPGDVVTGLVATTPSDDATLNGGVPPVIVNPNGGVAAVQGFALAEGGVIKIGPDGGGGAAVVPRTFDSCAVVWRPIASTMVNTSGSTQVPLVIASNEPPEKLTVELTSVTASGKVDEMW